MARHLLSNRFSMREFDEGRREPMSHARVLGIVGCLAGCLLGASSVSAADSEALIKLLIKKGLITEQELAQAQTELAAEQTKAATPAAGVSKTVDERLTKLEKDLGDKSVIHVGHGTLKLGGLLQGWAVWDGNDNDRFRIRRTELKFAGDILGDQRFTYTVMIDPVQVQEDNTRRSILQDAVFTLDLDRLAGCSHHKVDLGQYKLPLAEEGLRSSAKLDFAERSFIGRTFGDQRDIGAMLTGDWPYVTYQLGVFNGSGQNQADPNDQKDVAGRLVLRPLRDVDAFKGLELGVSGYDRTTHGNTRDKKRLGFEARYEYERLALKAEYMTGQGTAGSNATTENATLANGWYAQAGYFLVPKRFQVAARVDRFDPNEQRANDRETDYTLGVNYFIDQHNAKAQLNWVHKDEQGTELDNDQVIGVLQYAF